MNFATFSKVLLAISKLWMMMMMMMMMMMIIIIIIIIQVSCDVYFTLYLKLQERVVFLPFSFFVRHQVTSNARTLNAPNATDLIMEQ
jgi:hypothetical protein